MHPTTQRLPIHPPNARSDLPAHAIPDRSQRKQATRLVGVATCCSSLPKLLGTHPLFERNRHHAPRPRISRIPGDGITAEDREESTPPDSKRRRLRVSLFAGWYYHSAVDSVAGRRGGRMRRREFIPLFGGAVVWPFLARGQQGQNPARIGARCDGACPHACARQNPTR